MSSKIVVAGATGELGGRIVAALRARGADVVALARAGATAKRKLNAVDLTTVDLTSPRDLARACEGAACVVSALQGVRNVIVGTQSALLEAACAAGVPRFIPSDFSTDFTALAAGDNRNFDLRREFHERLDGAATAATSIYNGAFAEILRYDMPLLDRKKHMVGYWQDADWQLDFTSMDDTAAFTAATALDGKTPRALRIASFQITPSQLAAAAGKRLGAPFELVRMGSLDDLTAYNRRERAAHPEGENEVFPGWQRSQYVQSMFSTHHAALDNGRYPDLTWSGVDGALPIG